MFDRNRLCIQPLSARKSKTSYYPVTSFALTLSDQEAEFIDEIVADIKDTVKKLKRWSWKPKIFGKKIVYKMLKSI